MRPRVTPQWERRKRWWKKSLEHFRPMKLIQQGSAWGWALTWEHHKGPPKITDNNNWRHFFSCQTLSSQNTIMGHLIHPGILGAENCFLTSFIIKQSWYIEFFSFSMTKKISNHCFTSKSALLYNKAWFRPWGLILPLRLGHL